jgi:ribosome biogenesis GTPase
MSRVTQKGLVVCLQSGFYTVETEQGLVTCHLRGRLKHETKQGTIVAVGDTVQVMLQSDGTGAIEKIEPRRRALVRLAPTPHGEFRQILLSNSDQVILVFACSHPEPHLRMLDRFLVICEKQEIPVLIVANKTDLVGDDHARALFGRYEAIGYTVLYTSVVEGKGITEFNSYLAGKISGLAGPSGVGKTSLLNAVQPELGLKVNQVSAMTLRGMHTTVVRTLFNLGQGGYIADLPGLRSLALWDTEPEELDGYFVEFPQFVSQCQFNDCTHNQEPDCAIRKAVEDGAIHPQRYISYLRLRAGDDD